MDHSNNFTPNSDEITIVLTAEHLERLYNPLSVVRGYTQLLQRRVRRGHAVNEDEILQALARIDLGARALTTHLSAIVGSAHSDGKGSRPE